MAMDGPHVGCIFSIPRNKPASVSGVNDHKHQEPGCTNVASSLLICFCQILICFRHIHCFLCERNLENCPSSEMFHATQRKRCNHTIVDFILWVTIDNHCPKRRDNHLFVLICCFDIKNNKFQLRNCPLYKQNVKPQEFCSLSNSTHSATHSALRHWTGHGTGPQGFGQRFRVKIMKFWIPTFNHCQNQSVPSGVCLFQIIEMCGNYTTISV